MWPLRTFNSKSRSSWRSYVPVNVIGVIAVLAFIEVGTRFLIPTEQAVHPLARVKRMTFIEENVIAPFKPPKILILGSSRPAHGIVPRIIEDSLNLPEQSCMNCSIYSAHVYDLYTLYRRNRARFKDCELVIVHVDDFWLNQPTESEWLYVKGSLADRLRADPPTHRCQFVLDGIFTFRWRLLSLTYDDAELKLRVNGNRQVMYAGADDVAAALSDRDYQSFADKRYKDFTIHPSALHWLSALVKMIQDDGARVVAIQMPGRQALLEVIQRDYPRELHMQSQTWKDEAKRLGVSCYLFREAAKCGSLTDDDFHDAVHLRSTGSVKFTRFLCGVMLRDNLLHLSPTGKGKLMPPRREDWSARRATFLR